MGSERQLSDYVDIVRASKNVIFHGAPGTGKTYLAKQIAARLIGCTIDELTDTENPLSSRFGFVQFHPSYDYTDFIEGYRPISGGEGGDSFGYELTPGIFKEFLDAARGAEALDGKALGEIFDASWDELYKEIGKTGLVISWDDGTTVTYQPRTEDSIKYVPNAKAEKENKDYFLDKGRCCDRWMGKKIYQSSSKKEIVPPMLDEYNNFISLLEEDYHLPRYRSPFYPSYVFVIDEINRGNISKILGELFYSIDPGYRGPAGSIHTQYSNAHPDEVLYVPENVYIIGTMNDIDRSVDTFDFATRRRFRFVEIGADDAISTGMLGEDEDGEATKRLKALNEIIADTDSLGRNYQIGASYLLGPKDASGNRQPLQDDAEFEAVWDDQIEPLIHEYLRGSYDLDEKSVVESMRTAFLGKTASDSADESADESSDESAESE